MKRIFGILTIILLAMATISIDYSFAEKPISYSRFKATKEQMEEGTPITIHGATNRIATIQPFSRQKLTMVHFDALDKDGNTWMNSKSLELTDSFDASFLASDNEFFIRKSGGGTQRFNPYDSTMLDRILDFIENDTKVEIRGIMVNTKWGPSLVIETIEPLESTPKAEATDSYVLTIETPYGEMIVDDIKLGKPKMVEDGGAWKFILEKE